MEAKIRKQHREMQERLVKAIEEARIIQQREVSVEKGLNFDFICKVSSRMSTWMRKLGDNLAEHVMTNA